MLKVHHLHMKRTIGLCPRDTVPDSLKLVIPKPRIASVVKELLSVLPRRGTIETELEERSGYNVEARRLMNIGL